jgi:hypothetical protein
MAAPWCSTAARSAPRPPRAAARVAIDSCTMGA